MPSTERISIQGTQQTSSVAPTRIAVLGPLPSDGCWSVTGTLMACDTAVAPTRGGGRKSVTYFPQFSGVSANGKAARNDTYGSLSAAATPGMLVQPQDGGAAQAFVIAPPTLVFGVAGGTTNQMELQVVGLATAVTWVFDLEIVKVSLP